MIREEIKNIKSSEKDLRNFGLIVGGVLVALGFLLLWRGRGGWPWLIGPGAALALAGLFLPGVLKPLQKVWMIFGILLGYLMTTLILAVLFYVVLVPLSFTARLFGRRPLKLGFGGAGTYWNRRAGSELRKEDLEKQF